MTSELEARWTQVPSSPIDELFCNDLELIFEELQQASLFGAALSFERPEGLTILLIILALVAFLLAFLAGLVVCDHPVAAWRVARPPLLENYRISGQTLAAAASALQSAESSRFPTAGSCKVLLGDSNTLSPRCTR